MGNAASARRVLGLWQMTSFTLDVSCEGSGAPAGREEQRQRRRRALLFHQDLPRTQGICLVIPHHGIGIGVSLSPRAVAGLLWLGEQPCRGPCHQGEKERKKESLDFHFPLAMQKSFSPLKGHLFLKGL